MKTFNEYINISPYLLSQNDKDKLLKLDKMYYEFIMECKKAYDAHIITNLDEQWKIFDKHLKTNIKYNPIFKLHPNTLTEYHIQLGENLLKEFRNFRCFLSEYYIQLITDQLDIIKYFMGLEKASYYMARKNIVPSLENYQKALEIVKNNKFDESLTANRNIPGDKVAKIIQNYIDSKGYHWTVKLDDELLPRMSVRPNKIMYVKTDAKFSKEDIEGLKRHEVDGHIGRRYYGLKTGLYIFLFGLLWRNILDEGLAVYNSLHKVKKPKPNIMFNIAIKTVVSYQLNKMDFWDLFKYVKEIAPEFPDKKVFTMLARFKREVGDGSLLGGCTDDLSYFCGYQIVKDMTDRQRDDILKYNIGPGQIKDLPKIKEFLKINKFESLI